MIVNLRLTHGLDYEIAGDGTISRRTVFAGIELSNGFAIVELTTWNDGRDG